MKIEPIRSVHASCARPLLSRIGLPPAARPMFPTRLPRLTRLMSTSPQRSQFILIAHDHTDPDALARRMKVRPLHLEGLKGLIAEGTFITGGAVLSETETVDGKAKMWDPGGG